MKIKEKAEDLLQQEEQAEKDGEKFASSIKTVYQNFLNQGEVLSQKDYEIIKSVLSQPIGYIDIDCYVQIMYMMGMYYEKAENHNGARYCAMRLLWMKECYEKPRKRRPRYLDMHPCSFEGEMSVFIERYTNFLEDTYRNIRHRLQLISILLILFAFAALTLLVRIPALIAVLEAFILCGLNYWIQMRRMPDMFQKNQTNVIEKYIDSELLDFDKVYRML